MPARGGIIAGYAIFVLIVFFIAFYLWKKGNEVKTTAKVVLHCDTCKTNETFTNMEDSEFKVVYACPTCGNPRRIVK
jgi:hypothetical protein